MREVTPKWLITNATEQRRRHMCRNIGTIYNCEHPAIDAEVHAAALEFVRKTSGFNKPSVANQVAFDHVIETVYGVPSERATKRFSTTATA